MSLTGSALTWAAMVAVVSAFIAVVWAWPRLAGGHPGKVLARVACLLGVNLLVLLAAAVTLNGQFLFFASWADLAGAINGQQTRAGVKAGGDAVKAARVPVAGAASPAPGALRPLPAGRPILPGVTAYQVRGPASGITAEIVVTVPPDFEARDPVRRYPVVQTFSGYPGAVTQWIGSMKAQPAFAEAVQQGRLRHPVLVSPQIEVPTGVDTECVNGSPGNPQVETWLTRDVPAWLVQHFPVRTDRGSWVAMGLSSGGYCAAMAGMLHPAQYGGAVVLGGYLRPVFEPGSEPYPPGSDLARRYDLVALAKRSPPPLALWLETSHADPLSYSSSSALLKAARSPMAVTGTVLQNAGHRMSVWQDLLPEVLAWVGQTLPGFKP